MNKIVGIQFRECGKIHYFNSGGFVLKKGDQVLIETEQGTTFGVVRIEPKRRGEDFPERPLKKVFRMATMKDIERFEKKCQMERDVHAFCYERIKQRSLPMCLVSVERLYDGNKIIAYFTAEGRVDFRELVRDLIQQFHTRVEMRQIGVRHQSKMVGGLGTCGRQLCCASFLSNFSPVSIRMAKDQNLSLNPSKISGMCGRLMCCLTYEHEYYEKAKRDIPKIGKKVVTTRGEGKVVRQNILRGTLAIIKDSGEEIEVSCSDIIGDVPHENNKERGNP